ncbi:MAG: MFS transporter [Deltaproteobacteria bacterium]|nr:MFS transporter [Deltaproteobacteria bacterium]
MQRFYPWVVLGIAFITVGAAFGCRSAFAVFLLAIIDEFHWSRSLVSGALILGSVAWTTAAPVIGMLLDRFGPRIVLSSGAIIMASGFVVSSFTQNVVQFYLGMGFLVGLGFAAMPMTAQAAFISNWFVRMRGMAMGITASGIGAGIFVIVPFTQWLVSTFGWRQAYLALATLLCFLIAPLNLFFQRRSPQELGLAPDFGRSPAPHQPGTRGPAQAHQWTLRDALRTFRFWTFALAVLTGAIPLHMILIHQVAAVSEAGFSKDVAAFALGLTGFFTAPSMIFLGTTSDRLGREWTYTFGSAAMIFAIGILLSLKDTSQTWMLYAFAPLFAFGFASRQSLYPTIAADLFHGKEFGAILGVFALFIGAGAGLGPWLGGYLHDLSGTYTHGFWIAILLAVTSVILVWVTGPRRYR